MGPCTKKKTITSNVQENKNTYYSLQPNATFGTCLGPISNESSTKKIFSKKMENEMGERG